MGATLSQHSIVHWVAPVELLEKHGISATLWLRRGLRLERDEPDLKRRLNAIDAGILSAR